MILDVLREELAGILKQSPAAIDANRPILEFGVDSLQIVTLLDEAARKYVPGMEEFLFGTGLDEFLAKPTIRELAAQLQRLAAHAPKGHGKISTEV